MKANELRIGNYLLYSDTEEKEPFNIKIGLSDFFLIHEKTDGVNYEPIPLTEEILLKCGFKKYITLDVCPTFCKENININDGVLYIIDYGFINHIKSLHQLQNLYFALTSQELKVQL